MTSDQEDAPFWYVIPCADRSRQLLQPDRNVRDVREELESRTPGTKWHPPKYEIVNKGPWPDWMAFWVPLLSERAVLALGSLIEKDCELLPWIEIPGHRYVLVNVIRQIPKQQWSCRKSSVYGTTYASADVIRVHQKQVPSIFRLEGYSGKVFVSNSVAQLSVQQNLRGAGFVDPSISESHLPFIKWRFGRKGTGFVTRAQDLPGDPEELLLH